MIMHFSIPDTSEIEDAKGSYTVFNIHINGVFHCAVRYRQLNDFQLQLKKEFGPSILPPFPPKKLLMLSQSQIDERRLELERFIQQVSQIQPIANSATFNSFLLSAQQASQQGAQENVTLDVYLANGHKISVPTHSTDQTNDVLEAVASSIELAPQFIYYFGLFLLCKEQTDEGSIVRRLQEFESPYISLKSATVNGTYWILLRKIYWDPSFDDDLLDDRVAMNLLYVQAVHDIQRGYVLPTEVQNNRLAFLQQRNSKKEYLRFVRTLKFYGHIVFKCCTTDYPQPDTDVIVSAGNRELNFRFQLKDEEKEIGFKVTRMRCWRISSTLPDAASTYRSSGSSRLELAFEYLVARNTLKWITLFSSQAILMSMCLQGMVDELIMKKENRKFERPHDRTKQSKTNGVVQHTSNGSSTKLPNSTVIEKSSGSSTSSSASTSINTSITSHQPSVSSSASSASAARTPRAFHTGGITDNDAFDGIRDDDL